MVFFKMLFCFIQTLDIQNHSSIFLTRIKLFHLPITFLKLFFQLCMYTILYPSFAKIRDSHDDVLFINETGLYTAFDISLKTPEAGKAVSLGEDRHESINECWV